jgi:hypothetical protein
VYPIPDDAIIVLFPVCMQTWNFVLSTFISYVLLAFAGLWLLVIGVANTMSSLIVILTGMGACS